MKNGRSLVALATELERQLATKRDMIVPTGLMHHETGAGRQHLIRVETPDGPKTYPTTELFRRQLADKLKIPFAYFERMRNEQATLLDRNVDTWLHSRTGTAHGAHPGRPGARLPVGPLPAARQLRPVRARAADAAAPARRAASNPPSSRRRACT